MTADCEPVPLAQAIAALGLADPCPACDGEGYHYVERNGRHATHPIAEIPCTRCGGTGLVRSAP